MIETNQEGKETKRVVSEQKFVKWEIRKHYWKREDVISKEDILEMTGPIKKICAHDSEKLEEELTMEEVSKTLKNTRNNVAPGASGFTGPFYKVFGVI